MNAIPPRPPSPGEADGDGTAKGSANGSTNGSANGSGNGNGNGNGGGNGADGRVRSAVEHVIREILPEFQDRDIPADKHLRELGADSIDRVEIILALIDRLKLADTMSSFVDIPNIGELILYLEERSAHERH